MAKEAIINKDEKVLANKAVGEKGVDAKGVKKQEPVPVVKAETPVPLLFAAMAVMVFVLAIQFQQIFSLTNELRDIKSQCPHYIPKTEGTPVAAAFSEDDYPKHSSDKNEL
ncbi:hypothetical protein BC833DRAFT_661521 [Globomyces pollinis-pini]|nr:hypothetical protein BC833DRAFT_661521 [Globomyces pollinis-pini]